ncbi:MAG: hypothetical protein M3Y59_24310 [Myxococcota bacterium]|nr:hypothetical protein [Myxococcota bacterium]
MSGLSRSIVVLLLVLTTSVPVAVASARCADVEITQVDDCCGEEQQQEKDACDESCVGCFCCPVRSVLSVPTVVLDPEPNLVPERILIACQQQGSTSAGGDIFQPPRA